MDRDDDISQLADSPPGGDDENPYETVDIEELPDWWRRNIKEFESHGMRPYRPPRFEDGVLTPPLISELKATFDVPIQFRNKNPQESNDWVVVVDGNIAATVPNRRATEGYTVYHMTSTEFEAAVRKSL